VFGQTKHISQSQTTTPRIRKKTKNLVHIVSFFSLFSSPLFLFFSLIVDITEECLLKAAAGWE